MDSYLPKHITRKPTREVSYIRMVRYAWGDGVFCSVRSKAFYLNWPSTLTKKGQWSYWCYRLEDYVDEETYAAGASRATASAAALLETARSGKARFLLSSHCVLGMAAYCR